MDQPPNNSDGDLPDEVTIVEGLGVPGGAPVSIESQLPPQSSGEGLCQSMPALGSMPYAQERSWGRRVVRLVSANNESDLSIELQDGVNKVGRQRSGNHLVLASGEISRFHAEIEVSGEAILVRDLNSSNGTFVNQRRVQESKAEAGDRIGFSTQFLFELQIDIEMEAPEVMTLESEGPESLPAAQAPAEQGKAAGFPESQDQRVAEPAPPAPPAPPTPPPPPAAAGSTVQSPALLWPGVVSPTPAATAFPAKPPAPADSLQDLTGPVQTTGDAAELAILERERRQLAVLYQVSKRCMAAENLPELDRLLINVLERIVAFQRGFITYQLPRGDWKLVMSPKGDRWERNVVRGLLQTGLRSRSPVVVNGSANDDQLGNPGPGRSDARLLLPLRTPTAPVGAVFLVSTRTDAFDDQTVDFLSLFSDIAALAVVNCARLEGRRV